MIEAKIILDSINPDGKRLTTWLLTYPRFIHSEMMTHRVFSRNSASSRAIPVAKQIEAISHNPAMPEQWGANAKGMQASEILTPEMERDASGLWLAACGNALRSAQALSGLNAHKQIANRLVEPFAHMTVLATATDHSNFFRLRAHPAAQPEFQVLAYRMLSTYLASQPQKLDWEEWHLPGLTESYPEKLSIEEKLCICVAMAARSSYSRFDEMMYPDKARELHDRLRDSGHWSPFEHAAQAISDHKPGRFKVYPWSNFDWPGHGGPSKWGQYRKTFAQENIVSLPEADLRAILAGRPDWVKV